MFLVDLEALLGLKYPLSGWNSYKGCSEIHLFEGIGSNPLLMRAYFQAFRTRKPSNLKLF